jgi:hypothetical protein
MKRPTMFSGFAIFGGRLSIPCQHCGATIIEFDMPEDMPPTFYENEAGIAIFVAYLKKNFPSFIYQEDGKDKLNQTCKNCVR